jgi:ribonuclease P protein component
MTDYAEANISTKQSSSGKDTRIQSSDGDQKRSSGAEETPREGAQTSQPGALLTQDGRLPRSVRLRKPAEFRIVYNKGRRYDGRLMSVFVLPNGTDQHRLGITASRKLARRAVDRNRLKRLLRETFRLSGATLDALQTKYDWVLNPRRALLDVKLAAPLEEFQSLVARVGSDVRNSSAEGVPQKP